LGSHCTEQRRASSEPRSDCLHWGRHRVQYVACGLHVRRELGGR